MARIPVADAFRQILNREPDSYGLNYWTSKVGDTFDPAELEQLQAFYSAAGAPGSNELLNFGAYINSANALKQAQSDPNIVSRGPTLNQILTTNSAMGNLDTEQQKKDLYLQLLRDGYQDADIRKEADSLFGDQTPYWGALQEAGRSAGLLPATNTAATNTAATNTAATNTAATNTSTTNTGFGAYTQGNPASLIPTAAKSAYDNLIDEISGKMQSLGVDQMNRYGKAVAYNDLRSQGYGDEFLKAAADKLYGVQDPNAWKELQNAANIIDSVNQRAGEMYRQYFGRDPDDEGLAYWRDKFISEGTIDIDPNEVEWFTGGATGDDALAYQKYLNSLNTTTNTNTGTTITTDEASDSADGTTNTGTTNTGTNTGNTNTGTTITTDEASNSAGGTNDQTDFSNLFSANWFSMTPKQKQDALNSLLGSGYSRVELLTAFNQQFPTQPATMGDIDTLLAYTEPTTGGTTTGGTNTGGTNTGGTNTGGTNTGGTNTGGTNTGGTNTGGTNTGGTNTGGTNTSGGVNVGGTNTGATGSQTVTTGGQTEGGQTATSTIPDPNRRVMAKMPLFNVGPASVAQQLTAADKIGKLSTEQDKVQMYKDLTQTGFSDTDIRSAAEKLYGDQAPYWKTLQDKAGVNQPLSTKPGVNYQMQAPKMPMTGYNIFDTTTKSGQMFNNVPLAFKDGGDVSTKKAALEKVKDFLVAMDLNPADVLSMIPKTMPIGIGMYPSEIADTTLEGYYRRQLEDERAKKPVGRANGSPPKGEVPSLDVAGDFAWAPPQPEPKRSLAEQAVGAGEAALSLGTSAVLSPLNIITQAVQRGIDRARGKVQADKNWEPDLSRGVYMPKTAPGQEALQGVSKFLRDTKLDAAMPQTQLMRPMVAPNAAQYAAQAVKEGLKKVDDSIPPMSPPMSPAMAGAGPEGMQMPINAPDISEQSKGIMDIAKPMEATRPKGSVMRTDELKDAFEFDFDAFLMNNQDRYKDLPVSQQKAAFDFLETKLMDYFRRDYGTPDDPLLKLFLDNSTTVDKKVKANFDLQAESAKKALNNPNQSATAKRDAQIYLTQFYDESTPVDQLFLRSKFPTGKDIMAANRQNIDKMRSQGAFTTTEAQAKKYVEDQMLGNFSPIEQRALQQGEILYTRSPIGFLDEDPRLPFDRKALYEQIMTVPPERLRDPTYTLVQALKDSEKNYQLIKDPKRIASRIDNGQKTTREQKFTETQYLPNVPTEKQNVGWFQLPTVNSLLIEGRLLKHCLSWNTDYQRKLLDGSSQFFSLRDKKGNAITSVELEKDDMGDYTVVKQVKSRFNEAVPESYAADVQKFIGDLASKYGPDRVVVKERVLPKDLEDYVTSTVTYIPDPPAQ